MVHESEIIHSVSIGCLLSRRRRWHQTKYLDLGSCAVWMITALLCPPESWQFGVAVTTCLQTAQGVRRTPSRA